MSFTTNNSVLYNVDQNFPESAGNGASKERARNNIGAASAAALTAETQRATDAEKAAKSEVVAGSGISVTSESAADGHQIYTVTNTSIDTGVFVAYWSGYGTGHGNTTYTDIKAANDAGKCVLLYTSGGGGSTVYYSLDNIDSSRAMFRRVTGTASNLVTVYASDDSYVSTTFSLQTALYEGTGIDITNNVVSWGYSVGRNLYLNTNGEIQTDLPGGKLHPTSSAWAEVGDLGAVYKVIARANGTGTYEVGLRYTGSGVSTTYTFIGKSFTTLDSSPSMSFSKIVNVATTLEYSTAFGPAFNPSSMESVTIEGTLILARVYDFRAVMYSDENGDVQVAFTAAEVGH